MRFPAHGMWLIFVGLGVVILFGASDGGISSGRRIGYRTVEPFKSNLVVIQGGLLAVLSLLLGFTLSMAVNRFEARKQLVLGEANAIETDYLRTRLLPVPEGAEIAKLLREYVDLRLQYSDARETLIDSRPRGNKPHFCRMNSGPGRSPMNRRARARPLLDCSSSP